MRILFVSANPDWTPRLDLLDELRELKQGLKGKHYELELLPAAQPEDLKDAIDGSNKPIDILHFSGHATREHGLLFRQANGMKKAITPDDLNTLFKNKQVKLALLNACHTKDTALGIKGFANTVIGTSKVLEETAAKKMTRVLYAALGNGATIDAAFSEATGIIERSGLDNVYMADRAEGSAVPDLNFASGDLEIDPKNEDKWDRYFFERYLEEQIASITSNVRLNQRVLYGLLTFGLVMILFSWGDSIALRTTADHQLTTLGLIGSDIANSFVNIGNVLFGRVVDSLGETPLIDWMKKMGEAIPLLVASLQHRWSVHSNEKIRQLKALKELVENSENLSDTLRIRLHKILDQSVRAANYPPLDDEEPAKSE